MASNATNLCDWCADIENISITPTCVHVHFKPKTAEKPAPPPPAPAPQPVKCVCSQYTFELSVDMSQYQANEIKVTTINNVIVIEAKHHEKHGEHGHVTKEFLRKCTLPDKNDINKVTAVLSAEGILKITAPKKNACPKPNERIIPVEQSATCC